ncbi:hypothetical protein [Nitrosomonas supralitoralis]|uniref:Uncharacterized protein n=1 Tax=Nitrosomonas supralitoralis TaxID=2116706 RepID=A0A2P7NR71_9PROT|nr:hypothetical protein [Nitrosomonas supralitoralis]PSJ15972.1 hypothetical protein C7H79_16075 [Nitrosomonas supralitoralis]
MSNFISKVERAIIMDITPNIATHLLSTSVGNRKIRDWHVDVLAGSMARGEWRITSQGIGIDKNGNLRDAHHRLMAVVKSGVTIRSVVVMGLSLNAYEVTDTGIARNMADLLNENKRITDILNAGARLYFDTTRPVTIDQMRPIMDSGLYDTAKTLIKHCNTTRTFYSSATVKLAACINIMNGSDAEYVLTQYRALCLLDFASMSPASMSLVKQVNDGKANARARNLDTICRALRTFDIHQKDSSESSAKPDQIAAAIKIVIDVLNNKIILTDQYPKPESKANVIKPVQVIKKPKKTTGIDDELKELLDERTTESYLHKSGDRKKYVNG